MSQLVGEISECKICEDSRTPFHFNIGKQPVMVISALPSLQAVYKPLTSIRFFRHLCVALFGDKYLNISELSDTYLKEFCVGNIYWTHYRKCYSPKYANCLNDLDNICAKKYLKREIDELKPKLIIVFGDEIKTKVETVIGNTSAKVIYKPFPEIGNEEIYDEVRKAVQPFMTHVKKTGIANKGKVVDYSNTLTGHEVHIRFEQTAYKRMWNRNISELGERTLDEVWQKNIVIPNMERCSLLLSAFALCENQIRTMLYEYFCTNDHYSVSDIQKYLQNNWLQPLAEYVSKERPGYIERTKTLSGKLKKLKQYRNAIVHNGGLITSDYVKNDPDKDPSKIVLNGIFSLAGFVIVTAQGIQTLDEIVDETADLLCKIQ